MEQRARVMGKTSAADVYRKFINQMKKKTQKNELMIGYGPKDMKRFAKRNKEYRKMLNQVRSINTNQLKNNQIKKHNVSITL